jgi:type VI secretion system protein ImpI
MMLTTVRWVIPMRPVAAIEPPAQKVFDGVGGVIGRGAACDWVIADASRLLSSQHGLVSYRGGRYFLIDISSNGIGVLGSTERLLKGQARLISEGDVYQLGALDIRARLTAQGLKHGPQVYACTDPIPDDAFLALDPLQGLEPEFEGSTSSADSDTWVPLAPASGGTFSHGAVERDHMIVPRWAEPDKPEACTPPPPVTVPVTPAFWSRFGDALGMDMDALDTAAREAMAIKVAGLFRQSIEGLQQSLRTRDELNSELNLDWAARAPKRQNPLKDCPDAQSALASLLGTQEAGPCSAEFAVAQVCREIQTHQLALVVACRAAVRGALAAFAPDHLLLCFERQDTPRGFSKDGAYWRAYQRHYRSLIDEAPLGEHLLRNDFSKAYEEQLRLVSTLHTTCSG